MTENRGQFTNATDARRYILGGHATMTMVGKANRYTYEIKACEGKAGLWFVSVMYGSDNESQFAYIGTLRTVAYKNMEAEFKHGVKSKISADDVRVKAFGWVWANIEEGKRMPAGAELWHEGRCCRCHRKLTVPSSIAKGIGPECATKSFMAA